MAILHQLRASNSCSRCLTGLDTPPCNSFVRKAFQSHAQPIDQASRNSDEGPPVMHLSIDQDFQTEISTTETTI